MLIACDKPEETDETAPIVSISNPVSGTTVEGSVLIEMDATDDESVEKVEVWINSILVNTDIESPWEYSWDTEDYTDGNQHSIQAKAFDPSGNVGSSELVLITVPVPNTAPVATFTVDPLSGTISTVFSFDASGCSDVEDEATQLQVRWDWESDNTWDTEYSTTKTASHQFTNWGSYSVRMEVLDSGGLTGNIQENIIVITDTITDIDGNVYPTIAIGDQEWMMENLKVTHYQDGTVIPHLTENSDWGNTYTGAYCAYNNDENNVNLYGYLYNGYAVADSHNIAPAGWHVPTDAEWKELEIYLGMSQSEADSDHSRGLDEGDKLKATNGWNWDGNGNNVSGFTALPAGLRMSSNGDYDRLGNYCYFWSASELSSMYAHTRRLYSSSSNIYRGNYWKMDGFSVRCVKD